jgi:hypothetical protein
MSREQSVVRQQQQQAVKPAPPLFLFGFE